MELKNRIRQRLDLQETRRQQLAFKEMRKEAEREEEEEFRRKVSKTPDSPFNLWPVIDSSVENLTVDILLGSKASFSFQLMTSDR